VLEKIYHSSRTSGYYNRSKIPSKKKINFRKGKIKAAIVTDFILSVEIVIIALGSVEEKAFRPKLL
jgi:predicted DNA repair protein MutK